MSSVALLAIGATAASLSGLNRGERVRIPIEILIFDLFLLIASIVLLMRWWRTEGVDP